MPLKMLNLCLSLGFLLNCTCHFGKLESLFESGFQLVTSGCTSPENQLLLDHVVKMAPKADDRLHVSLENSTLKLIPAELRQLPQTSLLSLSMNQMTILQKLDYSLVNLYEVYLDHNNISSIEEGFLSQFPSIFTFNASYNHLKELDSGILLSSTSSMLAVLDLSHNQISDVKRGFLTIFPYLKALDLSYNRLATLNADILSFQEHSSLEKVSLPNNQISHIGAGVFAYMPCVELLDLSNNHLTRLDTMIVSLDGQNIQELSVTTLRVDHNNVSFIGPSLFAAFPNLQKLHFSYNRLTHLSSQIVTMKNRTIGLQHINHVNFSHNDITFIDPEFFAAFPASLLANFLRLDLSYNELTRLETLPPGDLSVKEANLSHNKIFHIEPRFLSAFSNLDKLDLSHNRLTQLEVDIVMVDNHMITLESLDTLDLSHNRLFHIGEGFFHAFPNLNGLDLSYNLFTHSDNIVSLNVNVVHLGATFENKLHKLDSLNPVESQPAERRAPVHPLRLLIDLRLQHNNITVIKDNFVTSLSELCYLDLSFNNISVFSAKLIRLSSLYLHDNQLRKLDITTEIPKKITLQVLDLRNNHLPVLPKEIQGLLIDTVYLHGNPWYCDCNLQWMKTWALQHTTKAEQALVRCNAPFFNEGKQLTALPNNSFLCNSTIAAISCSAILLLVVVIGTVYLYKWKYELKFWLYHRYGFHPFDRDECENENKRFDIFVSYSNEDDEWARELVETLKVEGFCVCCHEQDFLSGTTIAENVERAVHYSKRTLCIMSRSFMASNFCMHEFITARSFDFSYKKNRLIMILYEDIPFEEMHKDIKLYVKSFSYLKKDCAFFMKRLKYALPQVKIGNLDDEHRPLLVDYNHQVYGVNGE